VKGLPTFVVGEPLIVKVVPTKAPVTPAGAPLKVALVAAPPIVYTIGVIAVPVQVVCVVLPDVNTKVGNGFTVIVPVKVISVQLPPTVVTEYVNGLPTAVVGEPLIVNTEPTKAPVTPAGAPLKVALVAAPPIVYTIEVIAVFVHTVCAVLPDV